MNRSELNRLRDEIEKLVPSARKQRLEQLLKKVETPEDEQAFKHMLKYLVEQPEQEKLFQQHLASELKARKIKPNKASPELILRIKDEFNDLQRSKNEQGS